MIIFSLNLDIVKVGILNTCEVRLIHGVNLAFERMNIRLITRIYVLSF